MHHSVVFVCMGNICRSPMAEIVFRHVVKQKGIKDNWTIDSAGTIGYHVGESPDPRSAQCCRDMIGESMDPITCRSRQVTVNDFRDFEYVLCMDQDNLRDLQRKRPQNATATLALLGSYDPNGKLEVDDPYYGGEDGFKVNFEHITRCVHAFLDEVAKADA